MWGEGPYENTYVKEDGVWKIMNLHWYQSMLVPYEGGWQVNEDPTGGIFVSDTLPPDAPPTVGYEIWPATYLPPFHFPNPVLGAEASIGPGVADLAQPEGAVDNVTISIDDLAERTAVLTQEIQLLEDENEIAEPATHLRLLYGQTSLDRSGEPVR